MTKTAIIQHFSEHGIIGTMSRKTLLTLLLRYQGVFEAKGVSLPEMEGEADIPKDEIKRVLMELHSENADAADLGERLDDIAQITDKYDRDQQAFDQIVQRYEAAINDVLPERLSNLDNAVGICLVDEAREAAQQPLQRLLMFDTKSFKEYPWKFTPNRSAVEGANAEDEEDENEAENAGEDETESSTEELPEFKVMTDEAYLMAQREQLEQDISAAFKENGYVSQCHVSIYPCASDKQVWFIIEHGGRHVAVEDFNPENGAIRTVAYNPLTRNVVVLDADRKVMRVKANTEKMNKAYLALFSTLLTGESDTFEDKPVYDFSPITRTTLADAFARNDMGDIIQKVEVVKVWMRDTTIDFPKVTNVVSANADISAYWQERYAAPTIEVQSVGLRLHIINPTTGQLEKVNVKLPGKGSLSVKPARYADVVREWLRGNGFERGYIPPELPCCLDDEVNMADGDDRLFWRQVAEAWCCGMLSVNQLFGKFSKRVATFMRGYMQRQQNCPTMASEWYAPNGKRWDVCTLSGSSYRYDADEEEPTTEHGKIEERELELLKIDKLKLIKALANVIYEGKPLRQSQLNAVTSGVYNLGEHYPTGTRRFIYVPGEKADCGYTRTLGHYQSDLQCHKRLVFISLQEQPPASLVEEDEVRIQHIFIGSLLGYSIKDGLVLKPEANTYITPFAFEQRPGYYTRWPYAFPESPSFHHIDIKMRERSCWIKFGEVTQDFPYATLPMFTKYAESGEMITSANLSLLKQAILIDAEYREDGWPQQKMPSSSLSKLSIALSQFFGIQEEFYEKTPKTANRQRGCLYRLAFGKAEVE